MIQEFPKLVEFSPYRDWEGFAYLYQPSLMYVMVGMKQGIPQIWHAVSGDANLEFQFQFMIDRRVTELEKSSAVSEDRQ